MFSKKDLRKLIIPLIIEQFLAITIGMADTVMVASCSEATVSGVALVNTINVLLTNIFSALATGGAIVCSRYLGCDEKENAIEAAKQLVVSVGLLSLGIAVVCAVWSKPILGFVYHDIEAPVMESAVIYFFFTALSYPFLGLYNAGAALFRAMGNSRVSMIISAVMNFINIAGNALLIFVFKMGAAGAALATLASSIVGAVFVLVLLRRPSDSVYISSYLSIRLKPSMIRSILSIGIPNGLENGMFQLGKIIVQGMIVSYGTAAIAANAVCTSIAGFPLVPGFAIGLAMLTVVGQCAGAKEYEQAKHYMWRLTGLTYVFMLVLNILIAVFRDPIIGFFNLSPEAVQISSDMMFWHSIFCALLWPLAFTLPNALRAAADARFTMIVSIISMWICRIGMSYVFGTMMGMGVLGTWFAMFLDWVARIILFLWRLRSDKWFYGRKKAVSVS